MEPTKYISFLCISSLLALMFGVIFIASDHYIIGTICLILGIIGLIIIVILPAENASKQMMYTVEITDPAQYQILIERGYSFKRLFENKEIYTIVGDVL